MSESYSKIKSVINAILYILLFIDFIAGAFLISFAQENNILNVLDLIINWIISIIVISFCFLFTKSDQLEEFLVNSKNLGRLSLLKIMIIAFFILNVYFFYTFYSKVLIDVFDHTYINKNDELVILGLFMLIIMFFERLTLVLFNEFHEKTLGNVYSVLMTNQIRREPDEDGSFIRCIEFLGFFIIFLGGTAMALFILFIIPLETSKLFLQIISNSSINSYYIYLLLLGISASYIINEIFNIFLIDLISNVEKSGEKNKIPN